MISARRVQVGRFGVAFDHKLRGRINESESNQKTAKLQDVFCLRSAERFRFEIEIL